jgi:hypothetical protein
MNADSSPVHPSGKRASLPGWFTRIFHLLSLFWVTEVALLIVVAYGLRAGWSTAQQWSDGFFLAAAAQVIVAAVGLLAPAGDALDASGLRYVNHADITDTRYQLVLGTLRRKKFGVRALIGTVLTGLISGVCLWL